MPVQLLEQSFFESKFTVQASKRPKNQNCDQTQRHTAINALPPETD